MGLLLLIVAILLLWLLSPLFIIYALISLRNFSKLSDYFGKIAFAIDQLGNVMGAPIMNAWLLKKEPAKLYGNPDETISHVTGVNYKADKLTWLGKLIAQLLDKVDKNHVEKAAVAEQ